jgi:hypothetical protein
MSRLHVFLAIVAVTCIAIGSTIAWSNIAASTGARAYVTKADFDQAFADAAAGRRESEATIPETFREGAAREVAAQPPKPFAGPLREPSAHGTPHPSKDLSDELKLGAGS